MATCADCLHVDKVIIDTYGFSELGRDYTDRGKAIR